METSLALQAAKYLLNNWHRYDQHASKLDYVNLENMKNLYQGLSKLTNEERSLLAEKYHHQKGKMTDKEVCKGKGYDEKSYTKKRLSIEKKLQELVIDNMDRLHEETGFAPYTYRRKKIVDGDRRDILTGLPPLTLQEAKELAAKRMERMNNTETRHSERKG